MMNHSEMIQTVFGNDEISEILSEKLFTLCHMVAEQVTEQEPAAWMHTSAMGHVYFRKNPQDAVFNPQPLYLDPLRREWKGLTIHFEKREWVGMTNDELLDIADMVYVDDLELLQNLQAKLKEKNSE
jgi:hypothetical protein